MDGTDLTQPASNSHFPSRKHWGTWPRQPVKDLGNVTRLIGSNWTRVISLLLSGVRPFGLPPTCRPPAAHMLPTCQQTCVGVSGALVSSGLGREFN